MTDRDRLIHLIANADTYDRYNCEFCLKDDNACRNCYAERLADYLLSNGAIVPPCKVGDTVYVIEPCSCFNGYRTFEECHKRRTNATKWIEAVMVANKHHNRCMKLFERPYKPEYYFKVGKTVFLTKEEAESKLKEREQDGC